MQTRTVAARTSSAAISPSLSSTGCALVRASGDAPLIDDFEAKLDQSLTNEGRGNWWFSYDDGTDGTIRREKVDVQPIGGAGHALHVLGGDFKRWGGSVALNLHAATTEQRGCPYDASTYTGIRLRARGQGRLRLMLADAQRTQAGKGGLCTQPGNRCYDLPGVWVDLEDNWRAYEFPFADFAPDGWGGSKAGVDSRQLFGLHFRIRVRERAEAWLDDVAFYRGTSSAPKPSRQACPLEAAPRTSRFEPRSSNAPLSDELSLSTFEQATRSCGPLTRRYLSYVPRALGPRSPAPVLVMFHGSRGNAEAARTFLARDRFDFLAARDRFIVVYGNAAPGPLSSANPLHVNNGVWREGANDDGQVDDVEYLERVLADLRARGVIAGDNPVFLVGHSNGGSMVLAAARRAPERLRGIAALMAFDGDQPKPVPDLSRTRLRRVFLAYTVGDPAMPTGYHQTMAREPVRWATAMGIPAPLGSAAQRKRLLPDLVVEGEGYTGTSEVPLATRNSRATELDILAHDGSAGVRTLVMDRAGHYWPNPQGDKEDWVIHQFGFRNQDLDAADAVWEFLRKALE